jgi:hypothetical protein
MLSRMNPDEITLTQLAERERDEKELTAYTDGERLVIEIAGETSSGGMEMEIALTPAQANTFYKFLGRCLNSIEPRATPYPPVVVPPELFLGNLGNRYAIDLTGCDTAQKAADAITAQTNGECVGFVAENGAVGWRWRDGSNALVIIPEVDFQRNQ